MRRLQAKIDDEIPGLVVLYPENKKRTLIPLNDPPSAATASTEEDEKDKSITRNRGCIKGGFRALADILRLAEEEDRRLTAGSDAALDDGCPGCNW